MLYRLGVVAFIASYISVSFASHPCACARLRRPVCGSDGKTYSNKCMLECAAVENPNLILERPYSCERKVKRELLPCPCPASHIPVCGTNGETYANECLLNCAKQTTNVEIQYHGSCRTKREQPCICTYEYDPVCGIDGVEQTTYANKCDLQCTQRSKAVRFLHNGPCRVKREEINVAKGPTCLCTTESAPVCASNGLTYSNPCVFNCAKETSLDDLHIVHEGECESKGAVLGGGGSSCDCPKNMQQVCASNGQTYDNECFMNCQEEGLTVINDGPCL